MQETTSKTPTFDFSSFRFKFILVVGAAVIFDLIMSGSVSIWNMQRLSEDARSEVNSGLTESTEQFLETYILMTTFQADLLINQVHSELTMLALGMQELIDNPEVKDQLGDALLGQERFTTDLVYNATGKWSQNEPGAPSAVSVWGYLLDDNLEPQPATREQLRQSKYLDLMGPALMESGASKLQVYYVGPKNASILRATPYSDQAATFDEFYPGHNEGPNFWDFFFPGVYESWQGWLADPASRPLDSDVVMTDPYVDAITGIPIISFFHPLWTPERTDVAGMVAIDITLDQLTTLVESIAVAETGFGFLLMSNGNVIAINEEDEIYIGLEAGEGIGEGVTGVERSIRDSTYPAVAQLELPDRSEGVTIQHLNLGMTDADYMVVQNLMQPLQGWNIEEGIGIENMTMGFFISEAELYQLLTTIEADIGEASRRILNLQVIVLSISLVIVVLAVYAISGRITSGLSALAVAARQIEKKDYSVRIDTRSKDEVGKVGHAFNSMVKEIRLHTENLENLVEERTRDLEKANQEIVTLNEKLQTENLRLGAELEIAQHIQTMVLPRSSELDDLPALEISGYMMPADEVGGDYYDVLQSGKNVKIGIGDVTGHGLESGVLMLMVQSIARGLYEQGEVRNEHFLDTVNRAVFRNLERTESDKHLTLAFIDYDDEVLTLTGQHEVALILRVDGTLEKIDTVDLGFPVGLEFDIAPFLSSRKLKFSTGDTLILHTDGVTEAENSSGEMFGLDRLCESVVRHAQGKPDQVIKGIVSEVMAFIGEQTIFDDITMVVMKHR